MPSDLDSAGHDMELIDEQRISTLELWRTPEWLEPRIPTQDSPPTTSPSPDSDTTGSSPNSPSQGFTLVLDCRTCGEFAACHINGSLHVTLPTILYKRLLKGTLCASSTIASKETREWFLSHSNQLTVILIPEQSSPPLPTLPGTSLFGGKSGPNLLPSPDFNGNEQHPISDEESAASPSPLQVSSLLLKAFRTDGSAAYILKGGISKFNEKYPHLCCRSSERGISSGLHPSTEDTFQVASCSLSDPLTLPSQPDHSTLPSSRPSHLGPLRNLKALTLDDQGSNSDSCFSSPHPQGTGGPVPLPSMPTKKLILPTSSHLINSSDSGFLNQDNHELIMNDVPSYKKLNGRQSENQFPVQILKHLFLGNAQNAADRTVLDRYNIRYILNVTPNLPNTFEGDAEFKYLQIPITDHWSQNLACHFPDAISFIEEARQNEKGVLVHCLAGISRSVTVTVAYLMQTKGKSMDDAYELVKNLKPNIAPNFNFMGQLLDLERELNGGSPDSGRSSASSAEDSTACNHTFQSHFISPTTLSLPPFKKANKSRASEKPAESHGPTSVVESKSSTVSALS